MKPIENTNLQESNSYFDKYFNHIALLELKYYPVEVDAESLGTLLVEYGISDHHTLFKLLAGYIPIFLNNWEITSQLKDNNYASVNEEIDLVNLSNNILDESIKWIEITSSSGQKIKLSDKFVLDRLGDAINNVFYKESLKKIIPEKTNPLEKFRKKKGRRTKNLHLAFICYRMRNFLNEKTSMNPDSAFISNKQARFICDFLEFTKIIHPENNKVLDEEYIRTLLKNYENKHKGYFQ